MQQQQPRVDHVSRDIASLRGLVEKSRPGTARHHDLEAVEKEVGNLTDRWDKVKSQISDRSVQFWSWKLCYHCYLYKSVQTTHCNGSN